MHFFLRHRLRQCYYFFLWNFIKIWLGPRQRTPKYLNLNLAECLKSFFGLLSSETQIRLPNWLGSSLKPNCDLGKKWDFPLDGHKVFDEVHLIRFFSELVRWMAVSKAKHRDSFGVEIHPIFSKMKIGHKVPYF